MFSLSGEKCLNCSQPTTAGIVIVIAFIYLRLKKYSNCRGDVVVLKLKTLSRTLKQLAKIFTVKFKA